MTGLLGDLAGWLIGAVAVVGAVFGFGLMKKRQGRLEGQAEVIEKTREAVSDAKERERGVDRGSKSDVVDGLRNGDI